MCGASLDLKPTVQKLEITREELTVIRKGLRAAKILASVAVKVWPQVVEAEELIAAASLRADIIRDRNRWGRGAKTEQTCRHQAGAGIGCKRPGNPRTEQETK